MDGNSERRETRRMTVVQKLAYWRKKSVALTADGKTGDRQTAQVCERPAGYRVGR